MDDLVKISIDTEPFEVLRLYGEDAYRRLNAKRLRCILHPEEEAYIYAMPKSALSAEAAEVLKGLDSVSNVINNLKDKTE